MIYVKVVAQRVGNKWYWGIGYPYGKSKIVPLLSTIYINQCKSQKYKCFSNVSALVSPRSLIKTQIFKSLIEILIKCGVEPENFAYLTRSYMILLLLIWVCHFKNHCHKMFEKEK